MIDTRIGCWGGGGVGSKRAGGGIYEHGLGKFKEIYNAGLRPDQNTVVVGEREGVEQRGGEGVGGRGKKGLSMKRERERGGGLHKSYGGSVRCQVKI